MAKKVDRIDLSVKEANEISNLSSILEQTKQELEMFTNQVNAISSYINTLRNEMNNNLMGIHIESALHQKAITEKLDINTTRNIEEINKEINERNLQIEVKMAIINTLEIQIHNQEQEQQKIIRQMQKIANEIAGLEINIESKDTNLRLSNHMAETDAGLNDLILAEDNLKKIQKLIDIYKHPVRYLKAGIEKPKGILLYGNPNLGKSKTAKALAKEIGYEMLHITPNNILNGDSRDPIEKLTALFEEIITKSKDEKKPYIIFLEQLDEIVANMGEVSKFDSTSISNTIKNYIKKIQNSRTKIIIMTSINQTKKIDQEFDDTFLNFNLFDNQISFSVFKEPEMIKMTKKLNEQYRFT